MEQEEAKEFTCGMRINASLVDSHQIRDVSGKPPQPFTGGFMNPIILASRNMVKSYTSGLWVPSGPSTPLGDFLAETNKRKEYELTPEEHERFDNLEGVTKEEIEVAKQVLAKTISVEEDKVRWRIYGSPEQKFHGVDHKAPFHAYRMDDPLVPDEMFPLDDIQHRIAHLDTLSSSLVQAMGFRDGDIEVMKSIREGAYKPEVSK